MEIHPTSSKSPIIDYSWCESSLIAKPSRALTAADADIDAADADSV